MRVGSYKTLKDGYQNFEAMTKRIKIISTPMMAYDIILFAAALLVIDFSVWILLSTYPSASNSVCLEFCNCSLCPLKSSMMFDPICSVSEATLDDSLSLSEVLSSAAFDCSSCDRWESFE